MYLPPYKTLLDQGVFGTGAIELQREPQTVILQPLRGKEFFKDDPSYPALRRRIMTSPFSRRLAMKKMKKDDHDTPVNAPVALMQATTPITTAKRNGPVTTNETTNKKRKAK